VSGARAFVEVARTSRLLEEMPAPAQWLSPSENARLAALRHSQRREQYLAGHWLARVLLTHAFGREPMHWSLLERRSLPPLVSGHEESLRVSLSHAGDWIAAAVADAPVGIDIEPRGRVLDAALEPLLLEPGETSGSVVDDALLRRWVAKEAWLKREAGLALPEQLARLRLREVARAHADVRLECHDEIHLAIALVPGCVVERRCEVAWADGESYAVGADQ